MRGRKEKYIREFVPELGGLHGPGRRALTNRDVAVLNLFQIFTNPLLRPHRSWGTPCL